MEPNIELAGRAMLTDMLKRAALSPTQISRLVNGKITPKLDLAHRIEEMTGIPTEFWHNRNRGAAMWARVQEKKT
jgi:plasmid maintenance system antidote protein VapI